MSVPFGMYGSDGITQMWGVRIIWQAHMVGGAKAVPFTAKSPHVSHPHSLQICREAIQREEPTLHGTGFVLSSLFTVHLAHSRCLVSIC